MPRIRWCNFNSGLWVAGGRDDCPDNTLRRATGVSQLKEGSIRAARGLRHINDFGANQYVVFDGALFQSRGADLLRDGVIVAAGFPQTPNPRCSFLRMPPQADLVDWLFVGGGGNPVKMQADGTTPSKWGIDAPGDGMVVSSDFPLGNTKSISDMDDATDWVRKEPAGAVPADESTIVAPSGSSGSVVWNFTQAGTNRYVNTADFALPVNLTNFGTVTGNPSSDQDYIDFWIRLSNGTDDATTVAAFAWMEIAFSLGDDSFKTNAFTRRIDGTDDVTSRAGLSDQQSGTGSYVLDNNLSETDIVTGTNIFNTAADQRALLESIAQTNIMRQNDVWQRIRVPKATFDRVGGDTSLGWDAVKACRLTFSRTGKVTIYVDTLALTGGWGLQGNYKYLQVFKNSATGSRSNPNETPVVMAGINRGRILVGNIQQPTDPQVDKIELYRTVGNGEAFFFAFEVDVGQTAAFDTVVDFRGMFSAPYLTPSELPDVLSSTQVQLDNAPPPLSIGKVLNVPHLARAFWLDTDPAAYGNLYYSPPGRPESNLGFVSVTTQTDNRLTAPVVWNDVVYVFSAHALYRIIGETEPFVAQEVFGVPGCVQPDTVRATPYGVVWQAPDGPRLFDGNESLPLGLDALGPLLRGYAAEGLAPFEAVTAAYIRDDIVLSNGTDEVLICNLRAQQAWRHFDLVFRTLYAADDDTTLYGATNFVAPGQTFSLEDESADTAIDYEIQTPSVLASVDTAAIIQRVFIDIDSAGIQVTPTLILEGSEVALAPLATSERETVEYARLDLSRLLGVRLVASVTLEDVELFGIEADVFVPAGSGSEESRG